MAPFSVVCKGAVCASCGQFREQKASCHSHCYCWKPWATIRFAESSHCIFMVGGEQTVGFEEFGTSCHPGPLAWSTACICSMAQHVQWSSGDQLSIMQTNNQPALPFCLLNIMSACFLSLVFSSTDDGFLHDSTWSSLHITKAISTPIWKAVPLW